MKRKKKQKRKCKNDKASHTTKQINGCQRTEKYESKQKNTKNL